MEKKNLPVEQARNLEIRQQKDLALYSPKNCFKYSNKLRTIKDVVSLPSKSLGEFHKQYGKDWLIGYVSMWVIELNDNAQVKTKMSDYHIEEVAITISQYPIKVTDLTYFFKSVKNGKYGTFYENLSQPKLLEWWEEYFDERCEVAGDMSKQKHDNFSMAKDKMHPEVVKMMFDGVGEENIKHDHDKSTLGKRLSSQLRNPDEYKSPIQERETYLGILRDIVKNTPIEELKKSAEYLEEKGNEPDALEIINAEIRRKH